MDVQVPETCVVFQYLSLNRVSGFLVLYSIKDATSWFMNIITVILDLLFLYFKCYLTCMISIMKRTTNIIWKSYHQYFCKIYFTTEFQCEIGIPFHEICIEIVTVNKTIHYTWLIFELISVWFNAMCLSFQMYFGFVNGSTAENDIISLFLPRLFYFSSFFIAILTLIPE